MNMPKRSAPPSPVSPAKISASALPDIIRKLERRLKEFETADPDSFSGNSHDLANSLCSKLDGTLAEVFGTDTLEYKATHASTHEFAVGYLSFQGPHPRNVQVGAFNKGRATAIARIKATLELMAERLADSGTASPLKVLQAFGGLDLHPEIERAAGDLYRNGHYANAVEDAVKALNGLVRLRSGVSDRDGAALMELVFSPKSPILRFNDLSDQTDHDEQKGFMMMFSGAVSGLRNPRAHKFIQDDPERALEFIGFVSLLAKLLDSAKR